MRAVDCLSDAERLGDHWQLAVNQFVDDFRRADDEERRRAVDDPIGGSGRLQGLVAAVVSSLCREVGLRAPGWVESVGSPEPFFAFPAKSYEMRLRLMIESPPPFRVRNVFVPDNYLSRA